MTPEDKAKIVLNGFGFDEFMRNQIISAMKKADLLTYLVEVTLVPVEVFGADDGYGLMDAVQAWSDCNRARGHIYRRDDEYSIPHRTPEDVIKVYVPAEEMPKFDKKFGEEYEE